jgi:hypothetical protein
MIRNHRTKNRPTKNRHRSSRSVDGGPAAAVVFFLQMTHPRLRSHGTPDSIHTSHQDQSWSTGHLVCGYFGFLLVSGFCSILYELVWLRLAMAQFAVTTALISIVLSAFMIGPGLGSFLAGRYVRRQTHRIPSLRL